MTLWASLEGKAVSAIFPPQSLAQGMYLENVQ